MYMMDFEDASKPGRDEVFDYEGFQIALRSQEYVISMA